MLGLVLLRADSLSLSLFTSLQPHFSTSPHHHHSLYHHHYHHYHCTQCILYTEYSYLFSPVSLYTLFSTPQSACLDSAARVSANLPSPPSPHLTSPHLNLFESFIQFWTIPRLNPEREAEEKRKRRKEENKERPLFACLFHPANRCGPSTLH